MKLDDEIGDNKSIKSTILNKSQSKSIDNENLVFFDKEIP